MEIDAISANLPIPRYNVGGRAGSGSHSLSSAPQLLEVQMARAIPKRTRLAIGATIDELWDAYGKHAADLAAQHWDTGAIRTVLLENLSDSEFDALCIDCFPAVRREFTAGMTRTQKANLLLEFCQNNRAFSELADGVSRLAPKRFELHRHSFEPIAMKDARSWDVPFETAWRNSLTRYHESLYEQISAVRILGRRQAESLEKVFTDVYVLGEPTDERRYDIATLVQDYHPRTGRRAGGEKRMSGSDVLASYQRVFILGKPGAGKTTFLKHTALRAIHREIRLVPVFISLRELSDAGQDIFEFVHAQFERHGDPEMSQLLEQLLDDGRLLLLFDGLDEINQEGGQRNKIIALLEDFFRQYGACQVIVTCRVAAAEHHFEQLTYVEMAAFNARQIARYIDRWFAHAKEKRKGCKEAILEDPENIAIRELAAEPLLLSLFCLVYDGRGSLPSNRADLYDEATDALLVTWDEQRGIKRDTTYGRLSLKQKQALLAYVASETFEGDEYFVPERRLVRLIDAFLERLPDVQAHDGKATLRGIEAQHGILVEQARQVHSFSHLTLQEYYMARHIVDRADTATLRDLMPHMSDDSWREVFLLVAGMLDQPADFYRLFLQHMEATLEKEEALKALLLWAQFKGMKWDSVQEDWMPLRAFYLHVQGFADGERRIYDLTGRLAFDLDVDSVVGLVQAFYQGLEQSVELALACSANGSDAGSLSAAIPGLTLANDIALDVWRALTLISRRVPSLDLRDSRRVVDDIRSLRNEVFHQHRLDEMRGIYELEKLVIQIHMARFAMGSELHRYLLATSRTRPAILSRQLVHDWNVAHLIRYSSIMGYGGAYEQHLDDLRKSVLESAEELGQGALQIALSQLATPTVDWSNNALLGFREQLREVAVAHNSIGLSQMLVPEQEKRFVTYLNNNLLLLKCLEQDPLLNRKPITEQMFLPPS